jgi:hypothetical protein
MAKGSAFGLGLLTRPQLQAWLQVDEKWIHAQVKAGVFPGIRPLGKGQWMFDPQEVLRKVKAHKRPKDGCWACGGPADLCQEGRLTVRWCRRKKCGAVRIVRVLNNYKTSAENTVLGEGVRGPTAPGGDGPPSSAAEYSTM